MMILGEATIPDKDSGIVPYTEVGPAAKTIEEKIKREAMWLPGTADVNQWFEDRVIPEFKGNFSRATEGLYLAVTGNDFDDRKMTLEDMRMALQEHNPVLGKLNLAA